MVATPKKLLAFVMNIKGTSVSLFANTCFNLNTLDQIDGKE
jgi:hypothetical protein